MSREYYDVQRFVTLLIKDEQGIVTEQDYQIDHQSHIVRMRADLTDDEVFEVGYEVGRQAACLKAGLDIQKV